MWLILPQCVAGLSTGAVGVVVSCELSVVRFQFSVFRGGGFPVKDNLCVAGVLSEAKPPERGGIGDVSGRNHQCLLRDDSLRETVNGGLLSGGFATLNRPAKFGFFLSEKLGDVGRAAFQQPLQLRGDGLVWGRSPFQAPLQLRGGGLDRGSCQISVCGGVA